jgi:hypothetical protein
LLCRHAKNLSRRRFFVADGFGSRFFLVRKKLHGFIIKPAGIGCVVAKAVKHERILSHGWAQVNLPKLYCYDFVIDEEAQTPIRLEPEDASRQRLLVSSPDFNVLAAK